MSKVAKKLLCICLTVILALGLFACGSEKSDDEKKVTTGQEEQKEEKKPEPYAKGTVEGNHFESAWLNMQADFSEEYVMATEEEIEQIQSAGSEEMLNEEGQEMMEDAEEAGNVTNEMMVMALTGNPNCTLVVEKLPLENFTEKQYLEITKEGLQASVTDEIQIEVKDDMPTVTIAGVEYMCLEAVMSANGVELNSNTYVHIKDGYAIVLNATFDASTEQQKDELLAAFKPIK